MRRITLVALLMIVLPYHARAADIPITESDLKFDPDSVIINTGDTLDLSNQDEVSHNIQVIDDNGGISDQGLQRSGAQMKIDFAHPGIYKVRCSIYPQLKMSVTVR